MLSDAALPRRAPAGMLTGLFGSFLPSFFFLGSVA